MANGCLGQIPDIARAEKFDGHNGRCSLDQERAFDIYGRQIGKDKQHDQQNQNQSIADKFHNADRRIAPQTQDRRYMIKVSQVPYLGRKMVMSVGGAA